MTPDTDLLICGGGIAGLCAAASFGASGFTITLVDPAPPVVSRDAEGSDLRSTAFLQPARDFLALTGTWEEMAPHATPLQTMRIIDATAQGADRSFDAADISDRPFGWNLPNWLIRKCLLERLKSLPTVTLRTGVAARTLFTRTDTARVGLDDGTKITARLVLACDGRDSPMREAAGIAARTTDFAQSALSFAVSHPLPHGNISTEIHRSGGPFTLVPLPDQDGIPSSAVVWMEDRAEARRLAALPVAEFEAEATERAQSVQGPLTLLTRRDLWPIISRTAERFAGQRIALVAEAAHVAPPIGAQGLNMSLADIALLLELAQARPGALGDAEMLATYDRRRRLSTKARIAGVGLLNRISKAGDPLTTGLRATGVKALHDATPVRRALMRLGLGL